MAWGREHFQQIFIVAFNILALLKKIFLKCKTEMQCIIIIIHP